MRWNQRIQVTCDGCGMQAGATRHARALPMGDAASIELPKTWAQGMVSPTLALPGGPLDANTARAFEEKRARERAAEGGA